MCSTPNKLENVFCIKCGARLVPLIVPPASEKPEPAPPVKGLTLPAKPAPAAEPPSVGEKPSAEPAPTEPAPSSDWLERLRTTTAEEAPPAVPRPAESATVEGETPSWVRRLQTEAAGEEAPTVPAAPTMPSEELVEDIPDWLKTPPASVQGPSAPTVEQPAPVPAERQPSWMQRLREASESPEKLPEWLKRAEEQPAVEEGAPPTEEPSWLKRAEPSALPHVELPVSPTQTAIPEWLKEAKPEPSEGESKPAAAEEPMPGEPLIEALEAAAPPALSAKAALPSWLAETPVSTEEEEVPDWLRAPIPVGEPGAPLIEIPIEPAPSAIEPATPSEVPDWVTALKPAELQAPFAGLEKQVVEATGLLAGLRGVLPLTAVIAEPHAAPKPTTPAISYKEGARIFESILAAPAPSTAEPAARKVRRVWTMRPLVFLLLLLAVLIPFFLPSALAGSTLQISATPAAEFYDTLQALQPNHTVLLSFDYDPSVAGEMDLVAGAMVRHLIQRRVKIIAVSTLETGPLIAQRILDPAALAAGNYAYGTHYLILGYLPGHEAALSKLASDGFAPDVKDSVQKQPFSQVPMVANVKTLRDIALVVELAGSEDALKMWMEQVQPRTTTRIVAGVSAAVEPKARAYRNAAQLTALVSGLVGAAQYEVLSNQPGLALISVNAQTAAQLALVLIVILGNIVYWISRAGGASGRGRAE